MGPVSIILYMLKQVDRSISMQSSVKLSDIKLSETVQQMLCCPICKARLVLYDEHYQCKNSGCNFFFPIINGIPILIDEDNSVFSIDDFINQHNSTFFSSQTKLVQTVNRFLPDIFRNIKGRENYNKL